VRSIRRTLITTLSVGFFLLFAALGVVHYLHMRRALLDQFDRNLLNKANTFASLTEVDQTGATDFEFAEFPVSEYEASPGAEYYQVWRAEGGVLLRSPSLHSTDLPRLEAVENPPRIENITLPDGRSGRATSLSFAPHLTQSTQDEIPQAVNNKPFLLVMASSREGIDATLGTLRSGVFILGILSLMGTALVVWWTVGHALHPLNRIANETEKLDANDLNHRFPTEAVPAELRPISMRLNELFIRLEAAFDRERRFSADISHELRTPITELRTMVEVWLQQAADPAANEDPTPYFQDTLAIAGRMERLVDTLLALVRCQSDRQTISEETFDLSILVEEVWANHKEEAKTKCLRVEICHPPEVFVQTDRSLLAAVFSNLFSNAVTYTPHGRKVGCYIESRSDKPDVTITFLNSHTNLCQKDLEHLFEPFWQKDPSRPDENHCGLGLSLVRAYVDLLCLNIHVSFPRPQLFEISIRVKRPGGPPSPMGVSSMEKRNMKGTTLETKGKVINVLGGSCG
jgi:signal transduction histidine kinase